MGQAVLADAAAGQPRDQQQRHDDHERVGDPGGEAVTLLELGDIPHQARRPEPHRDRGQQHERPGGGGELAGAGQGAEHRQGRQHAGLHAVQGDPGAGADADGAAHEHDERPDRQQRQQGQLQQREHDAADDPGLQLLEQRGLRRQRQQDEHEHRREPQAEQRGQGDEGRAGHLAVRGGQQVQHSHPGQLIGGVSAQ